MGITIPVKTFFNIEAGAVYFMGTVCTGIPPFAPTWLLHNLILPSCYVHYGQLALSWGQSVIPLVMM